MKKTIAVVLAAVMIVSLSACERLPFDFTIGHHIAVMSGNVRLTEEEMRLIALQYKIENERWYKPLFGNDFWQMPADENMTYEEYVREYCVFSECRALVCLKGIAGDIGVTLDRQETEASDDAAVQWFSQLSEDEKHYAGASRNDVKDLFRDYRLAEKTIVRLIEGRRLEVSEEESRVADFSVIRLDSQEKAAEVLTRLKNGESFMTVAKESTLDAQIEYTASREDLLPEAAELIFSMSSGEVSDIIGYAGSFFIVYMENSYDTLLSLNHKADLLAERKYEGWSSVYKEYMSDAELKRDNRMFDELTLSDEGDFPYISMFEYFSGND